MEKTIIEKSSKKKNNITIPEKSSIKVYWDDYPESNTTEGKARVKSYFSKKYGIPESNINVIFRSKKRDYKEDTSNVEYGAIDNIMDLEYQKKLFISWLDREDIKINTEKLLKLDDKVNEIYNSRINADRRHRKWSINKIEIDNFLSFGDNNEVDYNKLKGVTLVTSDPQNTGGKCVTKETKIKIKINDDIKEITIGELNDIFNNNLNISVNTPYGYKKILDCGITAKNSGKVIITTSGGKKLSGAPDHRVKIKSGDFIPLSNIIDEEIETIDGFEGISHIEIDPIAEDLYDIQVDEVEQYYTNGIVSHNSNFSVDTLLFLFFGNTTKTSKNEEIFNVYRKNNTVTVKGNITIDGDDYIISRTLTRKLNKKGDGWNVSSSLEYYRILPDGTFEDQKGEARVYTENIIKESIGDQADFLNTIIITSDNLESILDTKPSERSRLLTKFIGLEVLENKEEISKEMSSEFKKKMKSNLYNVESLKNEIEAHENDLIECAGDIKESELSLHNVDVEITVIEKKREKLFGKKQNIDDSLLTLNPDTLANEIESIIGKGKTLAEELKVLKSDFDNIEVVEFDEDEYELLLSQEKDLLTDRANTSKDISNIEKILKQLVEGQICPTCKRALDGDDHDEEIERLKKDLVLSKKIFNKNELGIVNISGKILDQKIIKKSLDDKDRKSIIIDKKELDIDRLRMDMQTKKNLLGEYNKNKSIIDANQNVDVEIGYLNSTLKIRQYDHDSLIIKIEKLKNQIIVNDTNIATKNGIIELIKKENEIEKTFSVYEKMLGKNGVCKMVLKTVIPILNAEISLLLDGVCDFNVEMALNEKNEIEFLIIRSDINRQLFSGSGLEKTLGALAIRTVLGRVSTLPKPNILVFDEVLGKISDENLNNVRLFFEQIKNYFDTVLLITHREFFRDLSDHQILITKTGNVSQLKLV